MDTTVIFSPNEYPGPCQHSFEKFLLYGRKCLEKRGEKDKECAIGINVSLSLTNIRGFLKQQNKEEKEETRVQCTKD